MQPVRLLLALAVCAGLAVTAASAQAIPKGDLSVSEGEQAVLTFFVEDSVGDVQLGRLGAARGQNSAVRSLGATLVRDHTMTAARGIKLARAMHDEDAKLEPGDDNQIVLSYLSRFHGAAFDREYVKELIDAHKSDINTAKDALDFATNAPLRAYLRTSLAVDEKHLAMALAAQQNL